VSFERCERLGDEVVAVARDDEANLFGGVAELGGVVPFAGWQFVRTYDVDLAATTGDLGDPGEMASSR
jgi:hypothetical protein